MLTTVYLRNPEIPGIEVALTGPIAGNVRKYAQRLLDDVKHPDESKPQPTEHEMKVHARPMDIVLAAIALVEASGDWRGKTPNDTATRESVEEKFEALAKLVRGDSLPPRS